MRWWDTATGRLLDGPRATTDGGATVAFSRDGRFALTAEMRGGLRFWDPSTGSRIGGAFAGPTAAVRFDPAGHRIVWIDKAGQFHALPGPDAWADELCAKVSRTIGRDEWKVRISPELDYLDACPGRPAPLNAPAARNAPSAPA